MKIIIGDSTRGYDTAEVTKTTSGKYKIVEGTIAGRKGWIRKAIANCNRGDFEYVTSAGDVLPVVIR